MAISSAMAVDAADDAPYKSGAQQRMTKSCSECGRRFLRTEHLQRHQRIHTRETPFSCPYCHRSFQRSDVCNRHVARSCQRKFPNPRNSDMVERSSRVRVACDACRAKKLKCTGERPCSACNKGNRECIYTKGRSSRPSERRNSDPPASATSDDREVCVDPSNESTSTDPIHASRSDATDADVGDCTFAGAGRRPSSAMHLDQSPLTASSDSHDIDMLEDNTSASRPSSKSQHPTVSPSLTVTATGPASLHPVSQPLCQGTRHLLDLNPAQAVSVPPTTDTGFDLAAPLGLPSWDLNFGVNSSNNFTFDLFPDVGDFFPPFDFDLDFNDDAGLASGVLHDVLGPPDQDFSLSVLDTIPRQQDALDLAKAAFPATGEDAMRWLASEPSLKNFDRVIINHFINIFLREVPSTFTSFLGLEISKATIEEEVLAMAAIGGLYSSTRGSHIIARAMTGDARRLTLTHIRVDFPDDAQQKISLVRTLILLELYGICSGDKRYCELSEAFHIQFLQIISRCNLTSLPENSSSYQVAQRVMNDMQLLECYRATLLQWPPNFYMTNSSVFSIPRRTLRAQPDSKQFDAFGTIRALLTPSGPPVKLYQRSDTIHSLTALLLLTSHAALTQSTASEPVHIWDKRFFELGLHSWLRWQQAPPEASTLMLFHMGFIVLHTNMASLHSVVREFCIGKSPPPVTMSAIRRWRESDGCGIALEHAAQLLELSTSRPGRPAQATPSARSGSEENKGEAPHVAICVYLAVVTRWVAEISRPVPDLNAARAVLARGLVILQRLNLLIANGFANMLRRLEENCS